MKKITLWLFVLFTCWQINAQSIVIGTATTTTTSAGSDPIDGYFESFRYQVVYTAAELSASLTPYDEITALGFSIAGDYGGGDLLGYTIKMGHTSDTNSATHNTSPTTTVKNPFNYNPTVTAAGVFDMITFDTNFVWNGVDNVLVEICSDGPNAYTSPYGQVRSNTSVTNGSRYYHVDGATSCGVATATVNGNKPNIQFNYIEGTPPSCVPPSGFVSSSITSNSATISWNAASPAPSTGYEYYYSDVNTAPSVAGTATTALTANLSSLNASTTYNVWLRSDCGGTYSDWNGPFTFVTACASVTDFVQDFEGTSGSAFPVCWAKVGATGSANTQASTEISGARNLYMYSSAVASRPVVSMIPVSNASAGTHRMKMKVRANFTVGETIEFGYLTNAADATTFTAISSIVTNSTTVPQDFVSIPSGMPAGDVVFALRTGTALKSVLIDDVTWEAIPAVAPTCVTITSPTDLATNVSNSTVTWSSNADATGYKISVGYTSGATDVLNMQDVGNVLSYAFASDPSTTYFVTVYPYNAYGTATGCTEISFTTCDVLSPEILEPFDTFLPTCWQEADNGDLVAGPATFGTGAWDADGFANSGSTGAIKINIDYLNDNDWVISPVVSIPATGYELKFDAAATDWGATTLTDTWEADDKIEVLVSTSGLANWTVLYTYNDTNTPTATGTTNVIDLDAYAGQDVRFAFRGVEGTTDGAADIDFFIDNFNVRLTPSCLEPTMFTVTAVATDNVTVSWTAGASETQWEYVIQALGTGAPAGAGISTTNNPLTITGLTSNTSYEIYLRAVCSVADLSVWVGPFNLTTACDATNVPYSMNFETATVPALPNCTTVVNAGAGNVWNTVSSPGAGFTTKTLRYLYNSANDANTWFFTQGVNLTAGTSYRISYDYGNDFDFYTESLNVAYGSSADAASMTNAIASHPTINTGALQSNVVDFTPAATGVYYFGFQATSIADQNNLYLDNINVILTPACSEPLGLAVSNLTDTAADVSWTATTGSYEYVLDAVATDPAGAGTALTGEAYNATGLTPSTTYYFHVRTVCAGPTYSVWSTKMFTTLATPPVNDNCSAAQVLTPGGVFADQAVVGTNVGATDSGETAPTCASYQGGDVWYSVTVPASGNITIESDINTGTAITDTGLAVYSGSCGALTQVGCSDDDGNGNFSKVSLTGRTPGEVLLVSVWEYGGGTDGTFQVSAYDASLSSNSFDNASFAAYPNPVKDVFNVSYSSEISSIRVLNLLGQEVITKQVNATSTQIDMSPLSAGAYIVNVAVGDAIKTIKVVKQ